MVTLNQIRSYICMYLSLSCYLKIGNASRQFGIVLVKWNRIWTKPADVSVCFHSVHLCSDCYGRKFGPGPYSEGNARAGVLSGSRMT